MTQQGAPKHPPDGKVDILVQPNEIRARSRSIFRPLRRDVCPVGQLGLGEEPELLARCPLRELGKVDREIERLELLVKQIGVRLALENRELSRKLARVKRLRIVSVAPQHLDEIQRARDALAGRKFGDVVIEHHVAHHQLGMPSR